MEGTDVSETYCLYGLTNYLNHLLTRGLNVVADSFRDKAIQRNAILEWKRALAHHQVSSCDFHGTPIHVPALFSCVRAVH